jgi:hypothetical protein
MAIAIFPSRATTSIYLFQNLVGDTNCFSYLINYLILYADTTSPRWHIVFTFFPLSMAPSASHYIHNTFSFFLFCFFPFLFFLQNSDINQQSKIQNTQNYFYIYVNISKHFFRYKLLCTHKSNTKPVG